MIPVPDLFTPDDLTPEQLELRNFKKSPLARRISDDVRSPKTTRILLSEKKNQFQRLVKEKNQEKFRVSQSYFSESYADPFHSVKMPFVRIFPSRNKSSQPKLMPESSISDFAPVSFPDISEVFWNKVEVAGWKPETRQQATLTCAQSKLFLLGGVSRSISSDVNSFHPSYKKWEKLSTTGVEAEPRFGHTTVEYKNKLYVFGGGTDFNSIHKLRECLNGVKSFNTDTKEWANVKCEGSFIGTRKHHCAGIIGKHMFIHGGLNQRNNLLDDSAVLDFEKGRWKALSIKGPGPEFIAFHAAAVVMNPDQRLNSNLYRMGKSNQQSVKFPGIYIFGGINYEHQALDTMYLLKTGKKPLNWEIIETSGQGPSPRFQHSMVYNDKLNIIIVFGGRVDHYKAVQYTCFNDLYILKMDNLLWTTVRVLGNVPNPRSGQSLATMGSRLYLFAGVSTSTYCNSDLYMLELNPKTARVMIEDEERRKAREIEIELFRARRSTGTHDERIKGFQIDMEFE